MSSCIIRIDRTRQNDLEKDSNENWIWGSHSILSSTINSCFESLRAALLLPIRYFGSKSWSIPGVILRTPWLIFKRIIFQQPLTLKEELFGSSYHFFSERTLTRLEASPLLPYAALTQFTASKDQSDLMNGWRAISPSQVPLPIRKIEANQTSFKDRISGYEALLIENEEEVIVSFAALGAVPGINKQTPKWERWIHLAYSIITSNPPSMKNMGQSLIGLNPRVYEEADAFVDSLQKLPQFQNKKVVLTGLCYGAAIASYISIKRELPSICFNSFPLGVGVQQALGEERLKLAQRYVTHISIQGDYLTDHPTLSLLDRLVSLFGIRTPGHFGRRFSIPSAFATSGETHGRPFGSFLKYTTTTQLQK